ncbi:MAG: cupin domain-containing protein, partial [Acidimicrobiales bacterium]
MTGPQSAQHPATTRADPFPATANLEVADLGGRPLESTGDGVVWTLSSESQLNVHLLYLEQGHGIAEHLNDEVDVVVMVVDGAGELQVDGQRIELNPLTFAHVPKGTPRSIKAVGQPLRYLSIHRR